MPTLTLVPPAPHETTESLAAAASRAHSRAKRELEKANIRMSEMRLQINDLTDERDELKEEVGHRLGQIENLISRIEYRDGLIHSLARKAHGKKPALSAQRDHHYQHAL